MRRWAGAVSVALALALSPAAAASDPSAVYNDYARDGVLSCSHSRADLHATLKNATLEQYGDPYTLAGLRRAIRKQLAGGCPQFRGSTRTASASEAARQGGGSSGDTMLVLVAVLLVSTVGTAGWTARRALERSR
jgi:hypothetical protein